ncbi:LysR family transcriptional regulator [Janthinobacterium agaricidamnosum]|uniref:Bacterial regulatory helix-turn-helix, lysR family protein n=1 Tax=Janthinobacterium agaricidamnosum NBRC 102515 = DSM 9628 TaxID=1349767 RepID=W0VB36_9BURK|nr:LysR family transcriptional regulator [Janthinobacterium agaricidamnosum]CDG86009.1 bacterial regulatory helix-turn-helix, lysR family protein [Janthinobacterium agaricidamnosum NBRC 102515 = DSM 9628]
MMQMNFDVAFLRSFVAGVELGSFAQAAEQVGRSTSAVSAQIKKLEEQAGVPLFRKAGRGLALTDAGHLLLAYARRLVDLNDEAALALRGIELEGWVRLGLQEDFGEAMLPDVLGQFARAHPKVRIEAHVARNSALLAGLDHGQLDLALVWGGAALREQYPSGQTIAQPAMRWIGSGAAPWTVVPGEVLPLVAFDRECQFLRAATEALERAGIAWRIAFTSPSLAGLWAAAAAGLGLTVRTCYGLPASVRALDGAACGLPALPSLPLSLLGSSAAAAPPVERLAALILASLSPGRPI